MDEPPAAPPEPLLEAEAFDCLMDEDDSESLPGTQDADPTPSLLDGRMEVGPAGLKPPQLTTPLATTSGNVL
jgi:hypothetical protein